MQKTKIWRGFKFCIQQCIHRYDTIHFIRCKIGNRCSSIKFFAALCCPKKLRSFQRCLKQLVSQIRARFLTFDNCQPFNLLFGCSRCCPHVTSREMRREEEGGSESLADYRRCTTIALRKDLPFPSLDMRLGYETRKASSSTGLCNCSPSNSKSGTSARVRAHPAEKAAGLPTNNVDRQSRL